MYDIIASSNDNQIDQTILMVSLAFESDDLSRETVRLDAFLGDANLKAKELLPNWQNYMDGGDNQRRLESIVRKITACKLLASSERVFQRTVDDLTENKDIVKAKELISQYRYEIIDSVAYLKDSDEESSGNSSNYIVAAGVFDSY